VMDLKRQWWWRSRMLCRSWASPRYAAGRQESLERKPQALGAADARNPNPAPVTSLLGRRVQPWDSTSTPAPWPGTTPDAGRRLSSKPRHTDSTGWSAGGRVDPASNASASWPAACV